MGDKTKISAYRELTVGGRLIEMLFCKWTQEGEQKAICKYVRRLPTLQGEKCDSILKWTIGSKLVKQGGTACVNNTCPWILLRILDTCFLYLRG